MVRARQGGEQRFARRILPTLAAGPPSGPPTPPGSRPTLQPTAARACARRDRRPPHRMREPDQGLARASRHGGPHPRSNTYSRNVKNDAITPTGPVALNRCRPLVGAAAHTGTPCRRGCGIASGERPGPGDRHGRPWKDADALRDAFNGLHHTLAKTNPELSTRCYVGIDPDDALRLPTERLTTRTMRHSCITLNHDAGVPRVDQGHHWARVEDDRPGDEVLRSVDGRPSRRSAQCPAGLRAAVGVICCTSKTCN